MFWRISFLIYTLMLLLNCWLIIIHNPNTFTRLNLAFCLSFGWMAWYCRPLLSLDQSCQLILLYFICTFKTPGMTSQMILKQLDCIKTSTLYLTSSIFPYSHLIQPYLRESDQGYSCHSQLMLTGWVPERLRQSLGDYPEKWNVTPDSLHLFFSVGLEAFWGIPSWFFRHLTGLYS